MREEIIYSSQVYLLHDADDSFVQKKLMFFFLYLLHTKIKTNAFNKKYLLDIQKLFSIY